MRELSSDNQFNSEKPIKASILDIFTLDVSDIQNDQYISSKKFPDTHIPDKDLRYTENFIAQAL